MGAIICPGQGQQRYQSGIPDPNDPSGQAAVTKQYITDSTGEPITALNPFPVTGEVVTASNQIYTPYSVDPATTAGAYSDGDSIGGTLTLANAVATAGDPVTVQDGQITLDTGTPATVQLYLFVATPGAVADNAPFSPTWAQSLLRFAIIDIPAASFVTANSISAARFAVNAIAPLTGTSLFALVVLNGAGITLASVTGLNLRLNTFHNPA